MSMLLQRREVVDDLFLQTCRILAVADRPIDFLRCFLILWLRGQQQCMCVVDLHPVELRRQFDGAFADPNRTLSVFVLAVAVIGGVPANRSKRPANSQPCRRRC